MQEILQPLMSNDLIWAILAIATLIGGVAAIDQLCQGCLKTDLKTLWQRLFPSSTIPPKYTSGPVPLDSPFYVEPYEGKTSLLQSCYEDILRPAALLRIKAPRQMGKTSMMNRILHHAQQQGYRVVSFSFEEINAEVFANLDTFLQHFCATATEKLHLPPFDPSRHWQSMVSCNLKCGN